MQAEYATDVLFHRQAEFQPLYDQIVRTAVHSVKADQVAAFLGRRLTAANNDEIGNDFSTRIRRIRHTMGRTFGAEPKINNCNKAVFLSLSRTGNPKHAVPTPPVQQQQGERIMSSARLTQRRVDTLKPRSRAYEVRDPGLKGFGVRILPSGSKRYFLHSQSEGKRIWHAIGDGGAITLDSARSRARALLAARQDGNADNPDTRDPIPFETVADEVFQRYGRRWKPRTLAVNLGYYRKQILPWFKGKPVSDITRRDVLQWHASLHGVPLAADRSAPILPVVFKQAEAYGYRPEGSNPCTGIKRYRRGGRERFQSAGEIRRLSRVLDRHQDRHPVETSVVRLLLLTGCRKSEILTLQWSEYREGRLYLLDSKTGPRTVWLSSAARKVLDDLPGTGPWVFPSPRGNGPLSKKPARLLLVEDSGRGRHQRCALSRSPPLLCLDCHRPR